MRLSISASRESIWVWLFWGLGLYLVLEVGPVQIIGWVFKKTSGELVGLYLAFSVPWAIMAPLIWWLRKWEEQGASPKRLARGWGLSMALFGVAGIVATYYSGIELRLMDPKDAVGGFVATVLLSVPLFYFVMYRMALTRLSSRADGKSGGTSPE